MSYTKYSPGSTKVLSLQKDNDRVVMAHGCFDLLHLGHLRHLEEAKSWGTKLVVSVTADEHVAKGAGRPHFTAAQRVEALKALKCVDDAFINHDPDPVKAIRKIRPDVYVKGVDYEDKEIIEAPVCKELGIEMRYTKTAKWSSSRIINAERFSDGVFQYLEQARKGGYLDQIMRAFDRADKLTVAFVGERIIDKYIYVTALGKSSKEYTLVTKWSGVDVFEGGIIAASKQGEWPNARVFTANAAIDKTRYVDRDFSRKLFEVYSSARMRLEPVERKEFRSKLEHATQANVTIVFDFGHGLLEEQDRQILMDNSQFLAVNAQTNAGNVGFNPVIKYREASFVCIDEPEARLAACMPDDPLEAVVGDLQDWMECEKFLITRGKNGSYVHDGKHGYAPAFNLGGIDTMGAGDAVLAVTAPLIAAGLGLRPAALVGNVAGAIKVGILGHKEHVTRQALVTTIESLLK